MNRGFSPFEHTADIGVEAWADSLGPLLEEVARGLCSLIADPARIEPHDEKAFFLEGQDAEEVLVALSNEIIFYVDAEGFLTREARIDSVEEAPGSCAIRGALRGESLDHARHTTFTEIKSATYHDLRIQRGPEGFRVRVVFDV
jgi:SHS2 domain-containing protein